ncbi:phage/plasmid primase, P4 family [Desulfuromonas sp. TF]|uniref:phage/plasmid primase, P4 family n=1 Tax=Desulfuromonas sp. TF TaxID=1232410 RepID=UPI0004197B96|nr:phage/plasmid primase, P4 family [Desulfuromonas sp. TF]
MGIAKDHLSEERREAIARALFVVKSARRGKKGPELVGLCPLHDDQEPSFSYNPELDAFNCLGCGASGDLADLWCRDRGLDARSGGLVEFRREFGIESTLPPWSGEYQDKGRSKKAAPGANTEAKKGAKSAQNAGSGDFIEERLLAALPPLPLEKVRQMEAGRGWTRAGIERADLRLWKSHRDEERIAIPVRDEEGRLVNIRLYMPGAKNYKVISWSDPECPKCGAGWKWKKEEEKKGVRFCFECGVEPRTFGESRLLPPPPSWSSGPIWIVEGEPDLVAGISRGLNVTTQTAGAGTWKKAFTEKFKDRDVIIAYDADKAGLAGAEKAARELAKVARSVRIFLWPARMYEGTTQPLEDPKKEFSDFVLEHGSKYPVDKGEDLTDFFHKHGQGIKELQDLLPSAVTIEKPAPEREIAPGPRRFYRGRSFRPALLADALLSDMQFIAEPLTGRLFRWSGKNWQEFHIDRLQALALAMLGEEGESKHAANAARQVYLRSLLPEERELDDHHALICLANGMLNIETGDFLEHDPRYFATQILDFVYEESAECPRWLQFLEEVIPDKRVRTQLQQFFGYCLTRETRYGKCLLLHGPGSDGKSTILKVLQAMIGSHNCSAVQMSRLEDPFERATLYGKLLNIGTETEKAAFGSALFKAIVTGDFVNASFKHKDFFTYRPYAKLAFASNFYPNVSDNTDGYYRRILGIQFTKQFGPGLDAEEDKFLEDKLLSELPGIFLWSLAGLELLREHDGFIDAERSREFLQAYKRHNNPVQAFFEEDLRLAEPGEDLRVPVDRVYNLYKAYCSRNGHKPLAKPNFGATLRTVVKVSEGRMKDADRARAYLGIGLQERAELAAGGSPPPPPPEEREAV